MRAHSIFSMNRAVVEDIPTMIQMGARFFETSGLDKWFTYNPNSFAQTLVMLIETPQAIVLYSEHGMAAAMAYPCWFNREHLTAQELFWWVEPEARGGLLGAELRQGLENWAREKDCLTMEMGALDASKPEALARYYARLGYGPKERIFCRKL